MKPGFKVEVERMRTPAAERLFCQVSDKSMTTTGTDKEMILRRLENPDEEVDAALAWLRNHHYGPYKAAREYREDPRRLEAWRSAEKPSQAWRQGLYFAQALRLLRTLLYG